MKSSSKHFHRRRNHHQRCPMIIQVHGTVLADVKKTKRGEPPRAKSAENKRRRNPLLHFSPLQTTSLSTLLQKIARDPNHLILTWTKGIVLIHDGGVLEVINTVKTCFRRATEYWMYRIANKFSKYHRTISKNIRKMSKHMKVQMKTHTFDPLDPI